jgi:hypothetical protein
MSSLWIGLGTLAVSAGSAIASNNRAKKGQAANEANQKAYNKATIKSEKEARKLFDGFIGDYNASKEKLEQGMTLQEYIGNMVEALGDPNLEREFRAAKNGDWEQAQRFADEGTDQNISTFNRIVDNVSGGDYDAMVKARNKAILSEDIDSLYKEARRLQAPKQMAGSVKRDPKTGEVIGGQRADKFEFDISTTAIKENNDRVFAKTSQALEADRNTASRMQERAIQFLPMLDYSGFTASQVVGPYQQQKLQSQLAILGAEANMATNAMSMAYGKPLAPAQIDTSRYEAQTAASTQQALGALAELYKTQRATSATSSSDIAATNAGMARMGAAGSGSGTTF